MNLLLKFEHFYYNIKENRWYWLFSIFCRISLAFGFFAAGMVKIMGERFASGLSTLQPMGTYLEALHHTGFYYTFIGIAQVLAALLLLIPRTIVLGALLYFPIILNIWMLSLAVRFEGSFVTSPLMVFANLFLLVWNYDKLKYILPFKKHAAYRPFQKPAKYKNTFPFLFFLFVTVIIVITIAIAEFGYEVMPRNSLKDCKKQFENTKDEIVGYQFCECVHQTKKSLDNCLELLENNKK